MRNQDKKKKIIIGGLLGVLLLMVAGYAAFSSLLNISGTAGIAGQWKVEITEITSNVVSGSPTEVSSSIGEDKLSATFDVDLMAPGDAIEYTIKVKNSGNINATLTSMDPAELTSTNPAIEITKSGLAVGDKIDAGAEPAELKILVKYKDVTSLESEADTTFTLKLTFSQGEGGSITTKRDAADMLIGKAVADGTTQIDGLYKDEYEEGRYIFKGGNPQNYITFNNEPWRIMSIESDGTIKIIKDSYITLRTWDDSSTRYNSENTYCFNNSGSNGCNAWAAASNLVGNPTDFSMHFPNGSTTLDNPNYTGTVTQDSTLNTYLNNEYYNGLSEEAKKQITAHNFNVATPGNESDMDDMGTNVQQEALYKWNGKVGLMTLTEAIRASYNSYSGSGWCNTISSAKSDSNCYSSGYNWLWWLGGNTKWTISPYADSSVYNVWRVDSSSMGSDMANIGSHTVYPVVYLRADINLQTDAGQDGSSSMPYTIATS